MSFGPLFPLFYTIFSCFVGCICRLMLSGAPFCPLRGPVDPPRFDFCAVMPSKGLRTPFQPGHDVHFRLKVTERDPVSGHTIYVTCRFCIVFGQEMKPGAKWIRTTNSQTFMTPFCTDVYKWHHMLAHPEKRARGGVG